MDMENFGFANMEISTLMATSKKLNEAYLNRINKIFVLNSNWLLGTFLALSKPFMHQATKEKIIFVDDLSDLYNYSEYLGQFYDQKEIPADYGGKGSFLPLPDKDLNKLCNTKPFTFEEEDDDYEEDD